MTKEQKQDLENKLTVISQNEFEIEKEGVKNE
jgi:hypothetical protein